MMTRLPTQEQLELPSGCSMIQRHEFGRYFVYWGPKQVLVGEGLTEDDAIISTYKCLIKNFLKPAPGKNDARTSRFQIPLPPRVDQEQP